MYKKGVLPDDGCFNSQSALLMEYMFEIDKVLHDIEVYKQEKEQKRRARENKFKGMK